MSKKGPRSDAFNLLTGSLSEEVIAHYLELAYYVREQELARRREIERRKAAIKRAKLAALLAAWEAAARAAGIPLPERPGKARSGKSGNITRGSRSRGVASTVSETAAVPATAEAAASAPPETESAVEEATLPEPAPKANPAKSRARKPITREDILKLYVADSLGYLDKVRADGWGGLTCAESGRVGGMMTRRMKRIEKGLPLT